MWFSLGCAALQAGRQEETAAKAFHRCVNLEPDVRERERERESKQGIVREREREGGREGERVRRRYGREEREGEWYGKEGCRK